MCPTDTGVATAGCCPSGYDCGTASCFLATGSATASVAKELPGSGAAAMREARAVILGLVIPLFVGATAGAIWF